MATCPRCHKTWASGTTCPDDGEVLVADAPVADEHTLARGETIGEYVVEAKLGSGTFGDVYRGIQPLIGKQVAIKVLSRKYSTDPAVVSRFIAEARAVNQIRHKNIIDIFSFGQLKDGRHYHVMELLEGETLEAHLDSRRRLSLPEAVEILRPLARALDAAHASGIAHRDLKPANVFLQYGEEGRLVPKLLDFGVAKLLTDDLPRLHQTATGAAVGTPDYMSPEQCQGPEVDHRTDIYAFGVMSYQLLTGRLPFIGQNVIEVLVKQMKEAPLAPSLVAPGTVPVALDAPILAMLAKDREERPGSLSEAMRALEDAAAAAGIELPRSATTADPAPEARGFSDRLQAAASNPGRTAKTPSGPRDSGPKAEVSLLGTEDTLKSGTPAPRSTDPGRTIPPAATFVAPPPASRRLLPLALVAGAVLAGAAVLFFRPGSEPAVLTEPLVATATRAAAAAPPPPLPAAATASAAMPPLVEITVRSTPPKASVLGPGGLVLCTTPCVVRLPRAERPVRLELRAPGHVATTREVELRGDGELEVKLKRSKPAKQRPGSDDLENAFE